jgi:hypothetical protein
MNTHLARLFRLFVLLRDNCHKPSAQQQCKEITNEHEQGNMETKKKQKQTQKIKLKSNLKGKTEKKASKV